MCTNTIGSFYCNCSEGYLLDGNGLNCSGKQFSALHRFGAYNLSHHPLYLTQTSMSVRMMSSTTVVRMQTALTQREVSPAPATLATLEMESFVLVSYTS